MLIQANEEKWTYTESLYFTFIGILTVGMSEKIDCRWLNLFGVSSSSFRVWRLPAQPRQHFNRAPGHNRRHHFDGDLQKLLLLKSIT
jgi:hypothetical protein